MLIIYFLTWKHENNHIQRNNFCYDNLLVINNYCTNLYLCIFVYIEVKFFTDW